MREIFAALILAASSAAFAQQAQLAAKFEMPWGLTSVSQIDALRGPSSTGTWSAVSKQTGPIDLNVDFAALAASPTGIQRTVTFPGQTTAWTITALRLTVCAGSATFVCEQPIKLRYALPTPYTVRAGHPAVVGVTLIAAKQGNLAVNEDALTSAGPITPAPTPTPTPAPTATVTPTPTPTPAPAPSPAPSGVTASGTVMPPAASLVDSAGLTWTMVASDPKCEGGTLQAMQRNGVSVGSGQSMKICNGVVWGLGGGATWYQGTAQSTCGGVGWINARGASPC